MTRINDGKRDSFLDNDPRWGNEKMYNGKKRPIFRRHSPSQTLNNVNVAQQPDHRHRGHNDGRRIWPRVARPPVAIPAPGERGTWPPTTRDRATAATAQLPRRLRWCRLAWPAATPGRPSRRPSGEWTEVGRQVLVVVRIVQGGGRGRYSDPRPTGSGRSETGGHRDDQRRVLEYFAHLAFQAAKVGATKTASPRLARVISYDVLIMIVFISFYIMT